MQLDQNCLIVTKEMDGGDTCAEEARYWFLDWFNFVYMSNYDIVLKLPQRKHPNDLMNLLEVKPGIYVRNPDPKPGQYYANPRCTSRDQLQPVIWYCAAYRDYARLWRLFKAVVKRWGFAQNDQNFKNGAYVSQIPDCMWMCFGSFIRAGGAYTAVLYPILFIFDFLELIGNLGYLYLQPGPSPIWYKPWTWLQGLRPDQVDDNNTNCNIFAAVRFKPTPFSWLNRLLFANLRPKNIGNSLYNIQNNCLAAIAYYHNQENPEVTELYRKPILVYMPGGNLLPYLKELFLKIGAFLVKPL